MGIENSFEGIDKYAASLIRHKAKQLVGQAGFTQSDRQDLEQEMVLDLLQRLPHYDPRRAQRNTFIARIVEHKVASILKARTAAKRDYRLHGGSLNEQIDDGDGHAMELVDTVDQEQYLRRIGGGFITEADRRDLRLDLAEIAAGLPPELRSLCDRLRFETVTEISKTTGVPRPTIYDALKRIKARLREAGFSRDF